MSELANSAAQIQQANAALLAELETTLAALSPEDRRLYFFQRKSPSDLKLVNLLSSQVDAIRDPRDRRKFFLAHPELEVRYSHANFIPLE